LVCCIMVWYTTMHPFRLLHLPLVLALYAPFMCHNGIPA
jgi:hypothetical protein